MGHKILPFVLEVAHSAAVCVPEQINLSASLPDYVSDEEFKSDDPCVSRQINQPKPSCLLLPEGGL